MNDGLSTVIEGFADPPEMDGFHGTPYPFHLQACRKRESGRPAGQAPGSPQTLGFVRIGAGGIRGAAILGLSNDCHWSVIEPHGLRAAQKRTQIESKSG